MQTRPEIKTKTIWNSALQLADGILACDHDDSCSCIDDAERLAKRVLEFNQLLRAGYDPERIKQ